MEAAINDLHTNWMREGVVDPWGFAIFEYTIRHETTVLNCAKAGEINNEVVIVGFERAEGGLLLYHDWMLPLWVKFSEALAKASASGISIPCLSIGHVELPLNVVNLLAPAMKVAPIKLLHLKNNGLSRDSIVLLSKAISANKQVERLALKAMQLLDVKSVTSLVEPSRVENHLKSLSLDNCNIGLNCSLISTLLYSLSLSNIRNLSLAHNKIGSQETEMIANYLAGNPPITSLDLVGNLISDLDVVLITNALKSNDTLRGLRLSDNPLTEAGRQAICDAIYNITSLDAIHSSNHTCLVTSDFDIPDCNRYVSQNANRVSKLLGVLFTEFAFNALEEVPLGIVPFVFSFIQYPSFKLPLTRIYHLFREWETPMVHMCRGGVGARKRKRTISW